MRPLEMICYFLTIGLILIITDWYLPIFYKREEIKNEVMVLLREKGVKEELVKFWEIDNRLDIFENRKRFVWLWNKKGSYIHSSAGNFNGINNNINLYAGNFSLDEDDREETIVHEYIHFIQKNKKEMNFKMEGLMKSILKKELLMMRENETMDSYLLQTSVLIREFYYEKTDDLDLDLEEMFFKKDHWRGYYYELWAFLLSQFNIKDIQKIRDEERKEMYVELFSYIYQF